MDTSFTGLVLPGSSTGAADLPIDVRVGLGQMLVVPGDLPGNLLRAATMAAEAAAAGCDVLVLPECFDAGWTYPDAGRLATPGGGSTVAALSDLARENGLMIASGFTELADEGLYNSAVLIASTGDVIGYHRKINELDFARKLYLTGRSVSVENTPLGVVGLNICADNHLSSLTLGTSAAHMGARILLSPSSWAVRADRDVDEEPYEEWVEAYGALARSTGMPVVGVSNVGPVVGGEWDGWTCIGSSLVVDSTGAVLARARYGADAAELAVATVPLRPAA
jgi:predicted amidohydrolase